MPVTPDVFRQAVGSFVSGVTVVTTRAEGQVHGTTVSAFSSLSLDPPLVLVCVDKTSDIHDLIGTAGIFAVNILHSGQSKTSELLSRKGAQELEAAHRLEGISFRLETTGAPILEEHLAYLDCTVVQSIDAGDHTIYVGRVETGKVSAQSDEPLVYYRGQYKAARE